MKNRRSILKISFAVALLTLVIFVSAIAAVATAEADSYSKKLTAAWEKDTVTESYQFIGSGGSERFGYIYAMIADNGNKYVEYTPKDYVSKNAACYIDLTLGTETTTRSDSQNEGNNKTIYKYNPSDYPYIVYDFDIMTPTGTYGGAVTSFTFRAYTCQFKSETSTKRTMVDTSASPLQVNLSAFSSYLDKTPYNWQHVTFVMKYAPATDDKGLTTDANFEINIYINGSHVATTSNAASATYKSNIIGILPEDIGFYSTRISGTKAAYGTAVPTDDPSYVAEDPTTHYKDHIAFDNQAISYYTENYGTADQIAAERFTENYELPYKYTVATVTDSEGTVTYFDSFEKAFDTATSTDIVTLQENTDKAYIINKPLTVNSNGFEFNYQTTEDYILNSSENGIYAFKYNDRQATVYWDAPCADDCTCPSKHLLYKETQVKYGSIPVYPDEIKEPDIKDGLVHKFLGWSYENDGTADEIKAITASQAEIGKLYLYPIYESIQYSFEVITKSGTLYFLENEYEAAIAAVSGGGTIILHADVTTASTHTFTTANAKITIDLNGHDFKHFGYYNTHYEAVYNEELGIWEKGAAISNTDPRGAASGLNSYSFTVNAAGLDLTLKTAKAGADIHTYNVYRDLWLDAEGNVVGYDNVKMANGANSNNNNGAVLFYHKAAKASSITIEGTGLTYYGATVYMNDWGTNCNTCTFKINGGTYHVVVDTYMPFISQQVGGTLDVQNATIYAAKHAFVRLSDKVNNTVINVADFKFTDCNIIDGYIINNNTTLGTSAIKLFGCSYICSDGKNNNLTLGASTVINANSKNADMVSGATMIPHTKTIEIEGIEENAVVLNQDDYPTFEFTKTKKQYDFVYIVADIDEDCVTVNWFDTEGYWLDSSYALKNSKIQIPSFRVPSGDGWRGVTNVTTWTDEAGNISELYAEDAAEYNLFAVLPDEEDREYAACMTGAMFNMVYYTNFAYNVYVPKEDGVKITDLGGSVPKNTVWISNVEYWVYTTYAPSTEGLEDTVVSLTYVIDDVSYSAKFKPSAIFYANVIASDPYATAKEKEVIGCLIRYIEESYLAANNNVISEENQAKLDSFYDLYTPAPYVTEYPDAALFNSKPFVGLLSKVELSIESGRVKFIFTLTDEAVNLNYSIKAKGLTSALYTTDGKVFVSDKTPLRTHVMEAFTISIVDENGNTVTTTDESGNTVEVISDYSLAAYVNATGNMLAKSLYAFGTALRAYRPLNKDDYQISEITLFGENIEDYTIAADINNPTEYYVAEEIQALIYTKSGYWLAIVPSSEATNSIVVTLRAKTGAEGFSVIFEEGRIELICEYEALMHENALTFFRQKLATIGSVNFDESDNFTKNIRDIYYKDFGAVGDGVADDSEAIRAAHEYANKIGHTVCADPDAVYYIGPMTSHITVTTDVNWGNAKFIIDDSKIAPEDAARGVKLFNISGGSSKTYTSSTSETIAAINAAGGLDAQTVTKIDMGFGRAVMLQLFNDNHKNYIRYGANANSGAVQQEVILVDAEGNIDPSTPLMFDYEAVTKITVREIDASPITIQGGIFTTIANSAPCAYTQYARNIQVTRPNTTVKNITHYITGEGETGAPYDGFLKVHLAYNVVFEGCELSGHKIYYNASGTGMGTYDISAAYSINVTWKNCTQTNFFSNEATESTTKNTHWGIMGSSYCKNLSFENCRLTRFDAHAGVYNVNIKDCEMIHITIVGAGDVLVEDTTIYHNAGIQLRTDYGSFWHGDIMLKNISFRNTTEVDLVTGTWYNHDFGYPTAFPTSITVDGVTLKKNANINVFKSSLVTVTNNILKDSFETPVLDNDGNETGETQTIPNVNKTSPPESITVKNTGEYTVVFPDKELYPFFADCEYIGN